MGKKPKMQKLNATPDMNLSPVSTTLINGSDHLVDDPAILEKKSNNKHIYLRASGRLQNIIKPAENQEIEEIDLLDSGMEEDEPLVEVNGEPPLLGSMPHNGDSRINGTYYVPSSNHKTFERKIDDLIKAVQGFKATEAHGNGSCESTSVNLIYKGLYLESQKKIEALTLENHELTRSLEIALGKLEVYENMNKSTYTVISNLEKAIQALVCPLLHLGQSTSPVGDCGGVAKRSTAKKRKNNQNSETADSIQPPEGQCCSQESGILCNEETCFFCNSTREANFQTVRGTLLYENMNKSVISNLEKAIQALVCPLLHLGQSTSPVGDCGGVAKRSTAKKRKNNQNSK